MRSIKRIALYNPYLDILGGGEKHILSILKVFNDEDYDIDILWRNKKILVEIENDLNIKFTKAKVIPIFLNSTNFFKKASLTKKYSHFFYVTDGSYFFSAAEHNYIFCMYPKKNLYQRYLINFLKWSNFDFIANSKYTKSYIDKWTGKKSIVIYPYVDEIFHNKKNLVKKEKIILSAGRFFRHLHSKRQDLLIKSFIKLQQKNKLFKNFKLIFIGRLKSEDKAYFNELKKIASTNKNIFFMANVSFKQVINYYQKALFLWHATGMSESGKADPSEVEHLGLVPLEAMASGTIPFCFDLGGPRELIRHDFNGLLFKSEGELIRETIRVYKNKKARLTIASNANDFIKKNFSYSVFKQKVKKYFQI